MSKPNKESAPMKVLIAVDESPVSLRAARTAARLFGANADTNFLVINVSTLPPPWVGGAGFGLIGPFVPPSHWIDADDEPDEELVQHRLIDTAAAAGIDNVEPVVRQGDPVDEICDAAEEHDVDVIVVGAHEKSALRRLIDRSTATGVLRHSHVPVVVVYERAAA